MIAASSEIVAANGVSPCGTNLRHGLWPAFTCGETAATRFDDCAQDRQRQVFVAGFGPVVELGGKPGMFLQRAMPLTVLLDQATKRPFQQFQPQPRPPPICGRAGFTPTT